MFAVVRTVIVLLGFAVAGLTWSAPAAAQAPEPVVTPPELLERAAPAYPPDVLASGVHGRVVLALTIDEHGNVVDANVVESLTPAVDAAARDAALRSRFSPARRGDAPVPARILLAYELPAPSTLALPPPVIGGLTGLALVPGDRLPLAGAAVVVTGADGASHHARTDERGAFRFDGLAPGAYRVRVDAPGVGVAELDTAVVAGVTTEITARVTPLTDEPALEVTVRGPSESEQLRSSAQAVLVVETTVDARRSADLGEVLARSQGVSVRRSGGLGSSARLAIGGLADDQIRMFLDGAPLELSGHPLGLANVPVNLIERIEVYRGVVPARFGADALGGAINLVTDDDLDTTRATASYQIGAFGTHRLAAEGRYRHDSGLVSRASAFYDTADNDYPITVDVPDASGRLSPARVHRAADRYRATGATAEVGVVDRPWAERLLVRAFYSQHDKDVPHNLLMTVPYGEVDYGKRSIGGQIRYAHAFTPALRLDAVAGHGYVATRFRDRGMCTYDWFGRCVAPLPQAGEVAPLGADQTVEQHAVFARLAVGWTIAPSHQLRVALSPTFATRSGRDRVVPAGDYDPLTGRRDLMSGVLGLEYEVRTSDERVASIAFAKGYLQAANADEELPSGAVRGLERSTERVGVGESLRWQAAPGVLLKASYEYATRLPSLDELFGNGALIVENLHLSPETSHNGNVGVAVEGSHRWLGSARAELHGFGRFTDDLIVRLNSDSYVRHDNVLSARSLGIEATGRWTSPGEGVALEGGVTWQDFRNVSNEGAFARHEGDRIPNHPYLQASGGVHLARRDVVRDDDEVSLAWSSRYVHEFFRGWESLGAAGSKLVVPSQLVHTAAITYRVAHQGRAVSTTLEIQNLGNETAFDFYGVQRPGRAAFAKLVVEL